MPFLYLAGLLISAGLGFKNGFAFAGGGDDGGFPVWKGVLLATAAGAGAVLAAKALKGAGR